MGRGGEDRGDNNNKILRLSAPIIMQGADRCADLRLSSIKKCAYMLRSDNRDRFWVEAVRVHPQHHHLKNVLMFPDTPLS